jgi:hypothetical protein
MPMYKVPTLFLKDHLNRCDDCYENPIQVITQGKLISQVKLNHATYVDLLSDAQVYAELRNNEEYKEMPSLINSAITTLKRLKKSI